MRTIAVTPTNLALVHQVRRTYPDAEVILLGLAQAEQAAPAHRISALVVDDSALDDRGVLDVARLVSRFPELTTVAVLPISTGVSRRILDLGKAHVGAIVEHVEDSDWGLREAVTRAGLYAIARVVAQAYERDAPTFVAPNVVRAIHQPPEVKTGGAFAAALGAPLSLVAQELVRTGGFKVRRTLSWTRALWTSRRLGTSRDTVDQLAPAAGYLRSRSLYNAFHRLLGETPDSVRSLGGLWFAAQQFRLALAAWRERPTT